MNLKIKNGKKMSNYTDKNIKNYHYMINPNLIPFVDKDSKDMEDSYKNFIKKIKQVFK